MTLHDYAKTSFAGIRSNKSRSALTILGIVIGIAAIILIMSVGKGAENLILEEVRGLGSRTIIVEPGREPRGPSDFGEIFTNSLRSRDVEALRNPSYVQGLKELTPAVAGAVTVSYGSETKRTNFRGSTELIAKILELYPSEGSFFEEEDVKSLAPVAVIGADVKKELFGSSDAAGQKIKIEGRLFRVVGVLPSKGKASFIDIDDMVFIPYTTAQKYLLGINYFHAIIVQAETEKIVDRVARDIELTLRETHNISDPDKDDFHVMTQADMVKRIGTISKILSVLLISIAAISLVVGGIGIMNIMLVAVTERTQEIGLRKAVGATDKNILIQFLLEATFLTAIGGLAGVILGTALAFAAAVILSRTISLNWGFSFPVSAAFLGIGVAACIGLIFRLYPARRAALKNPIEALRHE